MSNLEQTRKAAIARRNHDKRSGKYPIANIAPANITDPELLETYRSEYYNPIYRKVGARPKGKTKMPLNVNVDPDVLQKARELGVQLSAACEEGLRAAIERQTIASPK